VPDPENYAPLDQSQAPATRTQGEGADGIPQTGEEDPLAEVSTDIPLEGAAAFARSERLADDRAEQPDLSDSIEPGRVPGSAEDIHVAGVTGPGPSG